MLETIQVGTPQHYALPLAEGGRERSWKTSFFRQPSPERRWLATTHLAGNAQADTTNHGTPNQAVWCGTSATYPTSPVLT
jgi:MOSC domain-containing protein YiiM